MTSDRDQLAELIHDAVYSGAQRVNWEDIADAILAAGWRPMTAAHTGWTPVRSVIIEWEEP